jgi:hypothetical protein
MNKIIFIFLLLIMIHSSMKMREYLTNNEKNTIHNKVIFTPLLLLIDRERIHMGIKNLK